MKRRGRASDEAKRRSVSIGHPFFIRSFLRATEYRNVPTMMILEDGEVSGRGQAIKVGGIERTQAG